MLSILISPCLVHRTTASGASPSVALQQTAARPSLSSGSASSGGGVPRPGVDCGHASPGGPAGGDPDRRARPAGRLRPGHPRRLRHAARRCGRRSPPGAPAAPTVRAPARLPVLRGVVVPARGAPAAGDRGAAPADRVRGAGAPDPGLRRPGAGRAGARDPDCRPAAGSGTATARSIPTRGCGWGPPPRAPAERSAAADVAAPRDVRERAGDRRASPAPGRCRGAADRCRRGRRARGRRAGRPRCARSARSARGCPRCCPDRCSG